jgi:3-oxoacyl-[acyl-carrier protein] reductase
LRVEEVGVLLENKNAVIYGGGGSIGGAVARAFAREGASVFLAGRTEAKLTEVADEIRAVGGRAETAVVDALDEEAVDRHADAVVAEAGSLDISFNLISHPYTHGVPFHEMAVADFIAPVETAARTTFITARAAARHMIPRRSGVILAFGGPGDRSAPVRDYYLGGTQVAFDAIETMRRQLSVELGPHGVRFVTLASGGVPETFSPDFEADAARPRGDARGRGQRGRLRGLGLGSHPDGDDRQRQLRRADRLANPAARVAVALAFFAAPSTPAKLASEVDERAGGFPRAAGGSRKSRWLSGKRSLRDGPLRRLRRRLSRPTRRLTGEGLARQG